MKLYTRNGDDGGTVLFDGTRVRKCDRRVDAYGMVDELNAHVGVAAALASQQSTDATIRVLHERLTQIQSELFTIGAELATPAESKNRDKISHTQPEQAVRLEAWIDEASEPLAPLRSFVLPGGGLLASQLHVCRTVCRRAERGVVALSAETEISPPVLVFLNRLSDLFFAWARLANHAAGVADVPWSDSTS
ncbi:MAG: cob(I)yrinic acid a,c-diamide adenosyltransferase [Phycisphaerales bacterium]|nr:cob(I)yrinic acid a,c-diamide adenosyltransferase [Phycisphaerales bacterium]